MTSGDVFCTHKTFLSHIFKLTGTVCRSRAIHPTLVGLCSQGSRQNELLKEQTTRVLTDVHIVVGDIVTHFSNILAILFPNAAFQSAAALIPKTLQMEQGESSDDVQVDGHKNSPRKMSLDANANEIVEETSSNEFPFQNSLSESQSGSKNVSPKAHAQEKRPSKDLNALTPSTLGNPVVLMETLQSIKVDLAAHESDIMELKIRTDVLSGLEVSNDELKAELIRKSEEIARLQEEMNELLTRNREQGILLEDLKNKLAELNEFNVKVAAEKDKLEQKIEKVKEECKLDNVQEVEVMKEQNEACLREVLEELSVIKSSISEKDGQLQRLKAELVHLADKLDEQLLDGLARGQIESATQVCKC